MYLNLINTDMEKIKRTKEEVRAAFREYMHEKKKTRLLKFVQYILS